MSTDLIRYDLLVQEALKGVVKRALIDAARDGLPGEHHFYISFRTQKAGVRLSTRMRERYLEDMTIVLQHQFSNLIVSDEAFEVGLSFSGVPERLRVPFDSLTGFFDPSVQFGLKFETQDEAAPASDAVPIPTPSPVPQLATRKKPAADRKKPEPKPEPAPDAAQSAPPGDSAPAEAAEETTAQVVSLDAFRKKN